MRRANPTENNHADDLNAINTRIFFLGFIIQNVVHGNISVCFNFLTLSPYWIPFGIMRTVWRDLMSFLCLCILFFLGNEEDQQSLFEVFRVEAETQPRLQALALPRTDYITQHPALWPQHPACREPGEYWWELPGWDPGERRQRLTQTHVYTYTHTQGHVFMHIHAAGLYTRLIHIHNYTYVYLIRHTYLHICSCI